MTLVVLYVALCIESILLILIWLSMLSMRLFDTHRLIVSAWYSCSSSCRSSYCLRRLLNHRLSVELQCFSLNNLLQLFRIEFNRNFEVIGVWSLKFDHWSLIVKHWKNIVSILNKFRTWWTLHLWNKFHFSWSDFESQNSLDETIGSMGVGWTSSLNELCLDSKVCCRKFRS